VLSIFGADLTRTGLIKAETAGLIPTAKREGANRNPRRTWSLAELPPIGERYGFMKKLTTPTTVAVMTTKGGVLKSTLALNLGRMAALHNHKVCIVGLDMQCDITTAMGYKVDVDDSEDLQDVISKMRTVRGLADYMDGKIDLDKIIKPSDIPTLYLVPETPELVSLERKISSINMRDFWLKKKVIDPLKERGFDLIIIDCSPNWNFLVSNALVACDVLISPLECKINNFRNYLAFRAYLEDFKKDTRNNFEHIFVPTKFASTRKLSSEIRGWYLANVPGCTNSAIRESVHSEESVASHLSLPEYAPGSMVADEMREVLLEIWTRILSFAKKSEAPKGKTLAKTKAKDLATAEA
jgi:chromosome partitioning protein